MLFDPTIAEQHWNNSPIAISLFSLQAEMLSGGVRMRTFLKPVGVAAATTTATTRKPEVAPEVAAADFTECPTTRTTSTAAAETTTT